MDPISTLLGGKVNGGFNLFVDGRGYAAKVTELNLPKLTIKKEAFQPGGFDAPIDVDLGMEKLEASFTLEDFDSYTLKYFGLGHNDPVPCTVRGFLASGDGTGLPLVSNIVGMWSEVEMAKFKRSEKFEQKVTVACKYYKLLVGGELIHEIDIENMVRIIGSKDYLALARAAIGV